MDIPSLYKIFRQFPHVTTDTRKIIPGGIFFALTGERFDGNAFANMAILQGAAYAVVSDPALKGDQMILVQDTLATLQALAHYHRQQLAIPVIAITGSNGKTTTKELVTAVLSSRYQVHATKGNLNNHIGVPLTLLDANPETELIVCEMGANHPGEIAFLCTIADPSHGIITNIGKAHLEGFGSLEGVKKAKGELFAYLQLHHGFCFINNDDPRLRELAEKIDFKTTFGFDAAFTPDICFSYHPHPEGDGFSILSQKPDSVSIQSSMLGRYNATNMLAAYTIGRHFQVDVEQIVPALSSFIPGANRSEIIRYQNTIVVKDAYNANPSSMELALLAFAERHPEGWVILGDMKEAGQYRQEAHRQILELALSLGFERIFLVGPDFQEAIAASSLSDPRIRVEGSIEQLKSKWDWNLYRPAAMLLKGSRSMHLEYLLEE